MNKISFKWLALVVAFVLCITFSSCDISKDILQVYPEVDFSEPQNVQISFNEHIYDTVIVFRNSKLEVNFTNEKDLMSGAYVSLDSENYKITYNDMVFEGNTSSLSNTFLPRIIYSYISSFESSIKFDSFDKQNGCYYIKRNINNYFVVFEVYENNNKFSYSMEIK